jgi:DNA-binding NtrC family response regulator
MASSRILVIALDSDVRRSLVFALEAEGYRVTGFEVLPTLSYLREQAFHCTVLDQRALDGKPHEAISFCITAHPVVLLAAQPFAWLADWVAQIVITPDACNSLAAAVLAATRAATPASLS